MSGEHRADPRFVAGEAIPAGAHVYIDPSTGMLMPLFVCSDSIAVDNVSYLCTDHLEHPQMSRHHNANASWNRFGDGSILFEKFKG